MRGNESVIGTLNELLADELTAINQYMVHAEMADNWHYSDLHDYVQGRAMTEMRHAEKLIARIIFLDGKPNVGTLNAIRIGASVPDQLRNDLEAEYRAVANYNKGVRQAADLGDNNTRHLLENILHDEEEHVDWLEGQLSQIEQMGVPNYLNAKAE